MDPAEKPDVLQRLHDALDVADSSARLQAALAAGTYPDPDYVPILIARCAIEPDFYVRDTLTWSLARHNPEVSVPLLLVESNSLTDQARSQALHTLSKIGDPRGWSAITSRALRDPDDEVARSAWRAAVVLVPDAEKIQLAEELSSQLGRGNRDVQLSLSRAIAVLGDASASALGASANDPRAEVRAHALATERLIADPDEGFDSAMFEARRIVALAGMPIGRAEDDSPRPE